MKDDICYSYIPATLYTNNGQVSNISTVSGLTGQTRYPSVEVRNFGTDLTMRKARNVF